ncbi:MAG: choice-of-anchor D domain-containing protein [Ideonella sp.]|nr:choice-of-anchor D domain-containing protein [Ideonella sp.]
MSTTQRHPRLNRLAAMLAAAGCIATPLSTQAVTIIGDSTLEVVDVPTVNLGSPDTLILGNQTTGNGVLTFRSGTLNVDHAISEGYSGFVTVGNSGTGSLFQNDFVGASTININGPRYVGPAPGVAPDPWGGYLFIGRNDGSSGTYTMEGGTNGGVTLNVQQDIQIGGSNVSELPGGGFSCLTNCAGTFIQRAGAVSARDVVLGIGSGTGTYTIEGGTLNAVTLDLGNTSAGDNRFTQTGGTVTLGGMFIANGANSNGTYTFEDGVLNSGSFALIGLQGTGQFIQKGGVHDAGDVSLGFQSTGTGTYSLSGSGTTFNVGTATTGSLLVGDTGQGVFNMTGGTLNINNNDINTAAFVVGDKAGSSGVFTQSGGDVNGGRSLAIGLHGGTGIYNLNTDLVNGTTPTLNVGFIALGNNSGQGTFNQQADTTNNTGSLFVGAQGIYNLAGGSLNVTGGGGGSIGQGTIVGTFGTGALFNQSGGTHTTNNLVVGNRSDGLGTYVMTGGDLVVNGQTFVGLGHDATNPGMLNGLFQQSGGNVTSAQIFVGGITEVIPDPNDPNAPPTFISHLGQGRYELSGGTVTSGFTAVGKSGIGLVLQTAGTFNAGELQLGSDGLFAVSNGSGGFGFYSSGTYDLRGGQLNTTGTTVSIFGLGTFNQSGGTHSVSGNLTVGFGPAQIEPNSGQVREGVYTFSGGTLSVTGDTIIGGGNGVNLDPGFAGEPGALGTFTQSGGTHLVGGNLKIGQSGNVAGGTGLYTLSSGVLTVSGNTFIGGSGLPDGLVDGIGTFTQTGGTHTTLGDMNVGGGLGTYNLGGSGILNTGITYVNSDNGLFNQTAGTHNTGFLNVYGGAYNLSGGTINVAGNMGVGGPFNSATFTQIGGDVFVNDPGFGLYVGGFAGSGKTGTYTLANGSLSVVATTHVGSDAVGTFEQTGGTHATSHLVLGENAGGSGTYNLKGGALVVSGSIDVRPTGLAGILNVLGGALSAASINNADQLNYSGGAITTNINNAAQVNVSGAGARTLTGNLSNNAGGVLTVAATSPFTISGVLSNNATASIVAGANITIGKDYNNLAAGSGNAFDRRANVTGSGQIIGNLAAQAITGNVVATGPDTWTLNIGNTRGGGGGNVTKNFQIQNTGSGSDIRGAIQNSLAGTAGLGNITDSRLSGAGLIAGNFGPIVAGGSSGNLSVTFNGAAGAALTGQKLAIVSNFDNVASQIINITGGAVSALAVGNATPTGSSTAVNLGNFRIGTAGADTGFSVQNQTSGAGAEQLGINGVSASSGFTAANAFGSGLIGPGAAQAGAVTARASGGGAAGVNTGTVTINYATDGTNVDASFSRIAANSQVINVQATGWNLANGAASPAGPVNLGNFHVGLAGGAAPQSNAIDITNNAPNLGFTEQLKVSSAGVSGAFALTNNIGGTAVNAGATFTNGLNVARNGGVAGLNTGTLSIQYLSDGTGAGNSGFSAIAANNQAITVNATGYRLASVNAIAAVNFGNVHVGDTVNQALSVSNTAINDGFSEKLNASFGGTTDARITTSGSFALLAAGQSNASSLIVGLNTTAAGSVNGTARVLLTSDGAGTSGLGTTALTPQDVGVSGEIITSGSVFRLASASPVAPNPVNFGNVRVGASTDQALTITNTAANDGFSEKLNASIGGATAGVTSNGGSFALLAAQGSNSTSLHVGLDTSSAGAKNGSATISLVSDGAGTSNLGQTPLPSQTVTITGGVYNMAVGVATPDPIVFANRRVGDAATQALTVANNAAGGGFSEALNASFSGASGAASNNGGTVLNLAAGSSNAASMNVGLNTGTAGARSGTVTLAYQSDGTGANGNSGLAAIAAGTQTISVSGNVYNAAVGNASPAPIVMSRRVNDVATQTLTVSNSAAAGLFSEALNAGFSASTGSASHNGGGISNLIAGGSDASAMSVSLNTSTAGAKSGTVTLAYQTDGTGSNGHSGLTAIAAGTQTISVSGNVYTAAVGQVLPPTTINFGVVHVGDVVGTIGIAVKNNAAVTALNDQLTGAITLAGGAFSASGNLGAGLGAGQTDSTSLRVGVNTSAAGVLTGSASVNLSSHNAEMADLLLGTTTVDLQAQVNNYANLDIIRIPGLGTFTRSGNVFTLNLGAFALGSGTQSATLNVKNAVSDPADDADGGFCLPGSPCSTDGVLDFALGGFSGFHDLQAGHSSGDLTIGFNTLAVGTYEDDIDLNWFGHNANWTQDGLTHYTLRILGTVYDGTGTVPEPGNLVLVLTALGLAAAATRRRRVRSSFGKQSPCAAKLAA